MADETTPDQDIDVANLSEDKIKTLMRRDPKFISRLISQLDKQMHGMLESKQRRVEQMNQDQEEVDKINQIIASHVQPKLNTLNEDIKHKTALREHLQKQLDIEMANFRNLEREAANLIQKARITGGKLMRNTASQRLQEARGFNATQPTTALLRESSKKQSPSKAPTWPWRRIHRWATYIRRRAFVRGELHKK